MEQKSRQFWWGNGDKTGINWLAWEKMKKNRNKGGVGFRDMEVFNKALLAKQSWRILINPHSLVAKILRHKYYREHTSIVDAKLGANPSYAWRSIFVGLEVLKKGLVKKLGNGGSTNLFSDPWIHRSSSFSVYSPSVPLADKQVCNYVIDGHWDIDKLNSVLWPIDVADISRMVPPQVHSNRVDSWCWFYEDHGCYTVKSGYELLIAREEDQGAAQPSHPGKYSWTKSLWKLKIPKKVCFLIWRIARNIIPTRSALYRRKIITDATCPFCDSLENSFHALVRCEHANIFWNLFMPNLPDNGASESEVLTGDWVVKIYNALQAKDRSRFCFGLWSLWIFRNDKVFNNSNQDIKTVVDRAEIACSSYLEGSDSSGSRANDVQEAAVHSTLTHGAADTISDSITNVSEAAASPRAAARRQEGDTGQIINTGVTSKVAKVQFDGAWSYGRRIAGGGVIIFDSSSNLLLAKAINFRWGNHAKEIEAYALEMGLDLALSLGCTDITIEGDAEILLNQLSGRMDNNLSDRSPIQDITDRIKAKALLFSSIHWSWIPREQNLGAHRLAALGLSISDSQTWTSNWPPWLSSSISRCSSRAFVA